ncbi:hypothetical protein [Undibacter mobilis]|uniref:Lipoprotein n=1 Tax=Undibacter mobilis TaxID=2292256 RepID=A0A371B6I5_9BRAD|nr:hypothetical protein [Undibacter mobilis]RDV03205.1 hypothetical protein DXH78_00520 [Undibacter mobilis]
MLRRLVTAALLSPLAVMLSACAGGLPAGSSIAVAGDYEAKLAAWDAARRPYEAAAAAYWDAVSDKRRIRNAKRRSNETILLDDYVLEHPPVYSGPPRPVDPNAPPGPRPGEAPPIPVIADFLRHAKAQFGFVPDQPASELDFKRAYARVALASGLTREQIVGVYAFETGGNGTYDTQAGVSPKRATAISPAVGYNQMLSTNSVSMLAEHADIVLAALRRKEQTLQGEARRAMARKIEAVKRMIAYAKSVPGKWSEYDKLAKQTAGGMGIHAIVLDIDIGPVVQTQKLLNSVLFARMKGYRAPLTAPELELMNLTGDSTGLDMVTMPVEFRTQVPTSNFFQRNGYERNPVARRTGVVGKLIADIDGQMQRGAQAAGSKELAAAAN